MADPKLKSVARYCTVESVQSDVRAINNVQWNTEKIQNSLSDEERQDPLLHFNIVTGTIISGKLWPLIFDQSDDPLVDKRTIAFMNRVIKAPQQELGQLDAQQAQYLFVGVRDLWLAESRGLLSDDEKKTLHAVLELLDDEFVPHGEHQSMSFSFCPSKHRRVLKFIENITALGDFDDQLVESIATLAVNIKTEPIIDEKDGQVLQEASEAVTQFYAVWVDPRELSYHNFENILPLDRALHFDTKYGTRPPPLRLELSSIQQPNKKLRVVKCKIGGPDAPLLLELDKLGLYNTPVNSSTRGGQRYIFSSSALSQGLTTAINKSDLFKSLARPQSKFYANTFEFVNTVFRCNRFAPSDSKFEMHMDTPYYDAAREHLSRFTMLIYLSDGTGNPALNIKAGGTGEEDKDLSVSFNQLSTFDCIFFEQNYPHEGQAFIDSNKVFLRSELIFEVRREKLSVDTSASKLFSSAVYFTLQSAFQPDYSRHAHELYERVNKAHWRLNDDTQAQRFEPIVLHKCWNGLHFATNGNDYWFPHVTAENDTQDMTHEQRVKYLKMIAVIAVLDYFNGRYGEEIENNTIFKTFRKECSSEQLNIPSDVESTSDWIMSYLWSQVSKETKHGDYVKFTDSTEKEEYFRAQLPLQDYVLGPNERPNQCCPACNHDFIPWKCNTTLQDYEWEWEKCLEELQDSPVVLLNNHLKIDERMIDVEDDKIYFRHHKEAEHVNFAACWGNRSPSEYITDKDLIDSPYLLTPPINFIVLPASDDGSAGPGYQLLMDFFNNDWVIPTPEDLDQKVSIPKLIKEGVYGLDPEPPKRPRKSYYYANDGYYDYDEDSDASADEDDDGEGLF